MKAEYKDLNNLQCQLNTHNKKAANIAAFNLIFLRYYSVSFSSLANSFNNDSKTG